MHKLMVLAAALASLSAAPGYAQTADSASTSGASSRSETVSMARGGDAGAQSGAATSGNNQGVQVTSTSPDRMKTVPSIYAPALTTTLTETCMGSTTAGGSGLGVGVTIGTTWHDEECVRRLNAREVGQLLGDRQAAWAVLCGSKSIREAYVAIGRPCPGSPGYQPELAYLPQPAPAAPPAVTYPTIPDALFNSTPTPAEPAPRTIVKPVANPPDGERG